MIVSDVVNFCKQNHITPSEYMVLKMLKSRSDGFNDLFMEYVKLLDDKDHAVFDSLLEKKLLILRSPDGNNLPQHCYIDPDKSYEMFRETSMGEEMYKAFPATFPLGNGSSFIARTGASKEMLEEMYLRKIDYSEDTHKFAMAQLGRYVELVKTGKIHGNKLIDWINNKLWEMVAEIPIEASGSTFKSDI